VIVPFPTRPEQPEQPGQPGQPRNTRSGFTIRDYVTNGMLTPPPTPQPGINPDLPADAAARVQHEWETAEQFRHVASADNTRRSYGSHVLAFADWCDTAGEQALPVDPYVLARHIAWYATNATGQGPATGSRNGQPHAPVSASTVTARVSAVNAVHRLAGYPPPGADPHVSEVVIGIRKTLGTASRLRKRAIDHASLRAMIAHAQAGAYRLWRDRAILWLRNAGATCGEMSRVHWTGVHITSEHVTVRIPGDNRRAKERVIRIDARPSAADSCPTVVFTRMRDTAPGLSLNYVFVQDQNSHKALSRQGIRLVCHRWCEHIGGYNAIPDTPRSDIAAVMTAVPRPRVGVRNPYAEESIAATSRAARDSAILTTGFYLALRRSNLEALNWGDLHFDTDSITVHLRRSKTDQEGAGRTLWLPDLPPNLDDPSIVSPTAALRRWRDTFQVLNGKPPADNEPVFCPLTGSGHPQRNAAGRTRRLGAVMINRIVQDYAWRAGLPDATKPGTTRSPYGAHSLRAGFVTESLRNSKLTIGEVMDITGHTSPDMVLRYRREAEQTTATAIAKMITSINHT